MPDGQASVAGALSSRLSHAQRVVIAVVVSTFFVGLGGGVVFPILPNLGAVLGFSPFVVGLILSANRFSRILANAPAGSLVDRIGTRTPFIVGLFIEGVSTFGFVLALDAAAPEIWFMVARALWGVGSALVFGTAYTIAADVSDGNSRGRSMGVIRGGMTLGFPAGLVMGGVVGDVYSIEIAFTVAAIFGVVAGVIAYWLVPETHVSGHRSSIKPWEIDPSIPTVAVGLVNFGIFVTYFGAFFATLVLFIDVYRIGWFGYGPQGVSGLLMAVTVVTASVFMFAGGVVSDRRGTRTPTFLFFLLVMAGGFAALAISRSLETLVVASILIGTGQGGTSGPLMALLGDLTPNERMGRAMGTNNILGDLGGGIGPLVSLPLAEVIGFSTVYAVCAVLSLAVGVVLLVGVYVQTGQLNPRTERPGNT